MSSTFISQPASVTSSVTVWQRLEPSPRGTTFEDPLQGQVRDPLWMLARQWQLGEFTGDDAGSPVQATYGIRRRKLSSFRLGASGSFGTISQPGKPAMPPLETMIEREGAMPLGVRGSVQLGLRFEAILAASGAGAPVTDFRTAYPIAASQPANEIVDKPTQQFRALAGGLVTDGVALWTDIKAQQAGNPAPVLTGLLGGYTAAMATAVNTVLTQFAHYVDDLYWPPDADAAWVPNWLSYDAGVQAANGAASVTLNADQFTGGHLDWYNFSMDPSSTDLTETPEYRTFFPNHVNFRGMTHNSWWQFEDGLADFGQLDTQKVDLPKMLVAEFAIMYGNDWFLVPVRMNLGELASMDVVVVMDTFGQRTLIRPTSAFSEGSAPWTMFTFAGASTKSDLMLLAPTLGIVVDAPNLESVEFLRDDMAALSWGVERALQGPMDTGVSALESYVQRTAGTKPSANNAPSAGAPPIAYQLGTTIPDNWLPLVPENSGPNTPMFLRRGSLVQEENGTISKTQPRGVILKATPTSTSRNGPLIIADQAVTPDGRTVSRYFRRARWTDGSLLLWMARQVQPGHGSASSGLMFDQIVPNQS